ncbi:MAG: helicase-associated domain-containing protein [Planctomycetota bacterium]
MTPNDKRRSVSSHVGARGTSPRIAKTPRHSIPLDEVLAEVPENALPELFDFWRGGSTDGLDAAGMRAAILAEMINPARVEDCIASLGSRLETVLDELVAAPRYSQSWSDLVGAGALSSLSEYDLEKCLSELIERRLVVETRDPRFENYDGRLLALPFEMAEGLVRRRRQRQGGVFGALTLRGHLDHKYADSGNKRMTPHRLRELYKMYSQESASVARIERLPEGIQHLVEKAILEFGGLLSRGLFDRMDSDLPGWNGRRWKMILEESLIGTVQQLDLSPFGIRHADETLIVFNEVALAWLRHVAVPSDPDRPYEELSLGTDLASNLARFISYIDDNDVRFTVRGEIFKSTERKIVQHLIPTPGRELTTEEIFGFCYRFSKRHGFIDRTGKRTFSVTPEGLEWAGRPLAEKQQDLLDFAIDDRESALDLFHQATLRSILLRLMKRLEPGVWYDLMYLPFLARNNYLASLDETGLEERVSERTARGAAAVLEDPQRLAWSLVNWVKKRLYLLGLVDLGYDSHAHPVAMRLTASGARLFGLAAAESPAVGPVGSLVVTPDHQVVLFRTGDDAELIHELDRFCVREANDEVVHFHLREDSVQRALRQGMSVGRMQETLSKHSRTPVPQNVIISVRDWAERAGRMTLSAELVLRCSDADVLERFRADAGARKYVDTILSEHAVQLASRATPKRLAALLRDLGYLVELEAVDE